MKLGNETIVSIVGSIEALAVIVAFVLSWVLPRNAASVFLITWIAFPAALIVIIVLPVLWIRRRRQP